MFTSTASVSRLRPCLGFCTQGTFLDAAALMVVSAQAEAEEAAKAAEEAAAATAAKAEADAAAAAEAAAAEEAAAAAKVGDRAEQTPC